ncbi:MAG TPA: pirin family protein [Vicinamibacteria bacterium]|nr:pirin family protein [Vicinamibacteria bacterium]
MSTTTRPGATITVRRGDDRGRTDWGWLDSRHTFSFGEYHDPDHMGFRALRVINDDRVKGGAGFGTHGHRDMEILSYVLDGALAHKDSLGTGSVIRPGEIQMMRAGTGVRHSEFNPSATEPVHFLQIWIVPDRQGLPPAYGQRAVDQEAARRGFALLASKDGRDGSLHVRQDVDLRLALLDAGERRELRLPPGRHAWVHVARGSLALDTTPLAEGDGAAVSGAETLTLEGRGGAEVLVFDLA